jgi:hypothetical protein
MTSRRFAAALTLILLSVGSLSACASLTTPRACRSACEVQESEPCQQCLAQEEERREEERRQRAEQQRNQPPPPSMPSGGGYGY